MESPPSSRDELRSRLNELEPGHPSSPWHEDGTPRDPAPRLSELEHPRPPLTDIEYKEHTREVSQKLEAALGACLTTAELHTIDSSNEIWSAERNKIHGAIIAEEYDKADSIPCEWQSVVAGGLSGAGNTTILEQHAGIDLSQYLTINPDKFKEKLAKLDMIDSAPGLSPMEATSLAHEESSHLARRLAMRAMADGKNIIWDITMSSDRSADRISEPRNAGYQNIKGVFVDIPIDASIARSEGRHRRAHDLYLAGEGLGGRCIPKEVIERQHDTRFGTKNRQVFEKLKNELDDWIIYDNSADGHSPKLIERKHNVA